MSLRLEGKVAIITGAGGGFGRATTHRFVREGALVLAVDLNEDGVAETLAEARGVGTALPYAADVSSWQQAKGMVEAATREFGGVDILFNNAGIRGETSRDIAHQDADALDTVYTVNLRGVWNGIHHAVPEMVRRGGGSIISTASVAALIGTVGSSVYGTLKGAVISLSYTIANEYGPYNIRSNTISPYFSPFTGFASNYQNNADGQARMERFKSGNPLHGLVEPEDIANAALFLASDESKFISGLDLRVDGGTVTQGQPVDMVAFMRNNAYGPSS